MQWQELRSHLRHLSEADLKRVQEAFLLGQRAHAGQLRKSGESFFTHPIAIAHLLADMGGDADTIIAALLHDTVEDTDVTLPQIRMAFGDTVGNLIDGLTKLERTDVGVSSTLNEQIETLRKMFTLMQQDIRIMVIKLIDRLHNMQTVEFLAPEKQRKLAQETLDVYVKIADRLSMQDLRDELESLAIAVLQPDMFRELCALREANERTAFTLTQSLQKTLAKGHHELLTRCEMLPEHKSWHELERQRRLGEAEVTGNPDIIIVFLCPTTDDCYAVLGALHRHWRRETLSFQDYINAALLNGYQGLHTTIILPSGVRVRCKIRTHEMHTFARKGIASRCFDAQEKGVLAYLPWTQHLSTVTEDTIGRSEEFWDNLQKDVLGDSITIHAQQGEAMQIPRDSTALDSAFYLFGEKALRTVAIKIDGADVTFGTPLHYGASVEVVLGRKIISNRTWLQHVHTGVAKAMIRSALGGQSTATLARTGKELLQERFTEEHKGYIEECSRELLLGTLQTIGYESLQEAYIDIANGHLDPEAFFEKLFRKRSQEEGARMLIRVSFRYRSATQDLLSLQAQLGGQCMSMRIRQSLGMKQTKVRASCMLSQQEQRLLAQNLRNAGADAVALRKSAFHIPLSVGFIVMLILWGLDPVFAQQLLHGGTDPINLTLIRLFTFFFGTALLLFGKNILQPQKFQALPLLNPSLLLAGLTLFLTACSTYYALISVSPSQYIALVLLGTLLPSEGYALLYGKERAGPLLRLGALATLLLFLLTITPTSLRGLTLAAGSGLGFTLYTMLTERYKQHTLVRARYAAFLFLLAVATLPYAVFLLPFGSLQHMALSELALVIGFVVIFTIVPYGLYYVLANRRDMPSYALLATAVPTLLGEAWMEKQGWLLLAATLFFAFTLRQFSRPQPKGD